LINKFRKKMLLLFAEVILVSVAITLALYYSLSDYYVSSHTRPGSALHLARRVVSAIGDFQFFLIVFTALFLILFWVITKKYSRPLMDVSNGISSISKGNFDVNIDITSNDEIGMLAHDVNSAARELKKAVEAGAFAEKSKDRLIVSVTHDLRTPLTSIMGYLELIVNGVQVPEDALRRYAEIAYNKASQLDTLVEDLFEIAKFNYGKIELNKKTIDLSCLIEQINEEFIPLYNENGIVSRICFAKRPVCVEADGAFMARVLENLLNNAVKYGRVTDCENFIDINLSSNEKSAVVQVINYGIQIPEEEQSLIFETFYRSDKSRSDSSGGTGLGLAIVKSIIEAHSGHVRVESSPERTVFEVELPIIAENGEEK